MDHPEPVIRFDLSSQVQNIHVSIDLEKIIDVCKKEIVCILIEKKNVTKNSK